MVGARPFPSPCAWASVCPISISTVSVTAPQSKIPLRKFIFIHPATGLPGEIREQEASFEASRLDQFSTHPNYNQIKELKPCRHPEQRRRFGRERRVRAGCSSCGKRCADAKDGS